MTSQILIPVTDASSIGEVRRAALKMADLASFGPTDAGRASIIAVELTTNLARHVNGGEMLISAEFGEYRSVEITSIDSGPGFSDIARCFEDGYSTAGTPGNGLGAVRRQSDEHDLFSAAGGTVLWTRVTASQSPPRPIQELRGSGLAVPAPGETLCGDGWRVARSGHGGVSLMIADGLGHGPLAFQASDDACKVFDANPFASPGALLNAMHVAIGGTRGAAIAVAHIDPVGGKLLYAGVGNISSTLLADDSASRGLFSHNGIVGHLVRKIQIFEYPWTPASLLVMHSDGLQTRWDLGKYPGLGLRHPAVIAGVLFRDFRRGRDDASVVVIGAPRRV